MVWNELSGTITDTSLIYLLKISMAEVKDEVENDDVFVLKSDLQNNYAKKIDIPEAVGFWSYVIMTGILTLPNDHVINSVLTTKLNSYSTTTTLKTTDSKFANYTTTTDLSKKHNLKSSIHTVFFRSSTISSMSIIEVNDVSSKFVIVKNDIDLFINGINVEMYFISKLYSGNNNDYRIALRCKLNIISKIVYAPFKILRIQLYLVTLCGILNHLKKKLQM